MTAEGTTPEAGKDTVEPSDRIQHMGALGATGHDLAGCGPAGHFVTRHAGNVDIDAEVFVDGGVWLAAESEDVARASTGIEFSPDQARRLARLLLTAADELEDTE